jgi:CTP synthase
VQVIPHITDEIKQAIKSVSNDRDVVIVEIGGTIGDIESLPFLEAIRQMRYDVGRSNVLYIHLTLLPFIKTSGELKTKPTQHSVRELRAIGIQPDVLLCRSDRQLTPEAKKKIAIHCNLEQDAVINAIDVETIYEVPLALNVEGLDEQILEKLQLSAHKADIEPWKDIVRKIKEPKNDVTIAIVGKYVGLKDSYKSLIEALYHGGIANDCRVHLLWTDSEEVEVHGPEKFLSEVDGILVPGGFGYRGIEGKVESIKYAREKKIPYFGICLGMQCAVIEFARNVCGLKANSSEFDMNTPSPVIYLMEKWYDFRKNKVEERNEAAQKGGTMRLGAYPCKIDKNSKAYEAYGLKDISERHRHRYEFNNAFKGIFTKHGMNISGASPDGELVEIVEIEDHPWFLGCQFHPEFKSRPLDPHPLFRSFIGASLREKRSLFPDIKTGVKEIRLD